jgi:hypothetical protein
MIVRPLRTNASTPRSRCRSDRGAGGLDELAADDLQGTQAAREVREPGAVRLAAGRLFT